ncbi:putative DnaJ domain, Chaperone J-domain superfamily [Helianthus annuus]|nr:putative DnaJ domain, Chaperone J-domain superfamily [Helianthus annuus]
MECNRDEAVRAKTIAESKMMKNDFEGGRKFALKAQKLFPELENMSQLLAVCDVHCAAAQNDAAKDLYGILQVDSLADMATIKKQYRKLALVLHPDKNHFPGAESAFKLIVEANMILSDNAKRTLYDYTCRDPTFQKPQSDSNARPSSPFSTLCPFCKKKYEYCRDHVNKRIKCPECSKFFMAFDIGAACKQNVNPPTSSQQEEAKVDPQRAAPQCTKKTGDGGSTSVENGGDMGGTGDSNGKCSKQSRKRSHSEEAKKRYRIRKSSSDVKDEQKEVPELKEENNKSVSDSEPVYANVPDSEFSNFDKDKEKDCFAVDQIWAIYDTIDTMPRFYAQIRKVYSSGFRLSITWLEADPEDPLERKWAEEGLPITCGKFKRGDTEETYDRLMFSHQMPFEKGSKRFSFLIYPRKGEIWALFKDWDITKWSSDPGNHMKYKFEIVEILCDFDKDNGVLVAYMVKVEGFVGLFQKTSRARLAEQRVPSGDLFRFSHRIPSLKLTGNERADVPVGSWELDTASLPDDLDQFYFSNNVKVKPSQPPEKRVKSTCVQNTMPAKGEDDDDDVNIGFTKSHPPSDEKEAKISIHNFSLDKQNWIFKEGQIWALGRSKHEDLRCYAQIKKIESSPLRLHVDLLELCNDTARPYGCGIYKAAGGKRIIQQDLFLYLVKAQLNGRNYFNIFPRKNEIWVLCKEQDVDVDAGDCDIVQVIENNGDILKLLPLTHVGGGYKSVFKGGDRVVEIPIDESHRFIYQLPAVRLTDELDGQLRGFWELDLAEFPGLVPI